MRYILIRLSTSQYVIVSDESPIGDDYVFEVDRIKFICSDDESTNIDEKIIAYTEELGDLPLIDINQVRDLLKKETNILYALEEIENCFIEAPIDFLGTGSSSSAATREEKLWRKRYTKAIESIKEATKVFKYTENDLRKAIKLTQDGWTIRGIFDSVDEIITFLNTPDKTSWYVELEEEATVPKDLKPTNGETLAFKAVKVPKIKDGYINITQIL